ncbi:helix-turn-helix transcriptional regulator [Actinospongicola halichondriae]|uniref:helix-turn-helix transcriptional regulator n=1 Tax=Actinospongicola halichondriae TaxID=3236844 RepID=UPI003D58456E
MEFAVLLRRSRSAAGLTQTDLADRSGIARPNVAAYEAGRREPKWSTAQRLLAAAGRPLVVDEPVEWRWTATRRPYAVASRLWRLDPSEALRRVDLPAHLWWSSSGRTVDLAVRADRLRAYEIVLREGTPADIVGVVDGVLLCEAWPELVLPAAARDAWERSIDDLGHPAGAIAS